MVITAASQQEVRIQLGVKFVSVLVFSRYFGFLPQSKDKSNISMIGDSKLPLSMSV